MQKKFNVLVTAVGGGSHGEQIVKALRLGGLDYHVVGADITPASSGRGLVDEFLQLPPASHPEYLDALIRELERREIRALFHGCEREMEIFSRNRERIETLGVYVPVNPPEVLASCQDKEKTAALLTEQGFGAPRYAAIRSMDDAARVDFLPVVLKPSVGGGGSANVHIARTRRELELLAEYLLPWCPTILAQEYVGTPEAEFTVGVLSGRDGTQLNSIAVRRLVHSALSTRLRIPNNTGRAEFGPQLVISSGVSQGEVGRFEEVTKPCEDIAAALGATAPINVQCRLVNDRVMVFEINPRFSGTTSLRAMVGYNEPETLIRRDVLGEDVEPGFAYDSATILRSIREIRLP